MTDIIQVHYRRRHKLPLLVQTPRGMQRLIFSLNNFRSCAVCSSDYKYIIWIVYYINISVFELLYPIDVPKSD